MADITANTICTEALKRAGIFSPTVAEITRARTEWLEEVKTDIWNRADINGNTRLRTLHTTAVAPLTKGQRRYALPGDFDEELSVTLLDSDKNLIMDAVATAAIGVAKANFTFDVSTSDAVTEVRLLGHYVLFYSGTAKGQFREVVSFPSANKCEVDITWDTGKIPASADKARIINRTTDIEEVGIQEGDDLLYSKGTGKPSRFFKYNDAFYLDKAPDQDYYGLRLRYYADLTRLTVETDNQLSTASAAMQDVYRKWRNVLVLGVLKIALFSHGDEMYNTAGGEYELAISNLLRKEIDYGGAQVRFGLSENGEYVD